MEIEAEKLRAWRTVRKIWFSFFIIFFLVFSLGETNEQGKEEARESKLFLKEGCDAACAEHRVRAGTRVSFHFL